MNRFTLTAADRRPGFSERDASQRPSKEENMTAISIYEHGDSPHPRAK
jgi:hypothetical protein